MQHGSPKKRRSGIVRQPLIRRHPHRFKTITADNGTEFHDYVQLERATGIAFYFATPHHSWERGTNENTNGLIRQYVPKGTSMATLSQQRCNAIARAQPYPLMRYFLQVRPDVGSILARSMGCTGPGGTPSYGPNSCSFVHFCTDNRGRLKYSS